MERTNVSKLELAEVEYPSKLEYPLEPWHLSKLEYLKYCSEFEVKIFAETRETEQNLSVVLS